MDCNCLTHPFQNNPGTSQRQRVMDDLLSGAVKIDARTMADLLIYFVQMSRHINFYDLEMNVNDWQPFFKKSIPFVLTSIIKFPLENTENNLTLYKSIFESKPSASGLQLVSFSLFHRFINNINNWHILLNDSSLPIAGTLDNLIRSKLQASVRQFIMYTNTAVRHYGTRKIDFQKIYENPVWGLDPDSMSATDKNFQSSFAGKHQQMVDLYIKINSLLTVFSDVITSLSAAAENNLELSFIPLIEELQKKHPPHLALLFAFLNMFRQLQSNLNEYTRKHLDYFYKEILLFKAGGAIPDRANILFEIQVALKSYLLKKGLKVKDGKDDNRQDILFALDDDIVVNQTRIEDKRTLFINNKNAHAQTYVEGVYIAPAAGMADGVEKDFADGPKNFPTLGSKYSKFTDPETKLLKPYPNARIGFILASPVFLLQAGSSRTIKIGLPCLLMESVCSDIKMFPGDDTKHCCNGTVSAGTDPDIIPYPDFYGAGKFYLEVNTILNGTYYYIDEDIIKEALKKGISSKLANQLRFLVLTDEKDPVCYCPVRKRKPEAMLKEADFLELKSNIDTDEEKKILEELIKGRRAFNFHFSGEEEWIEPSSIVKLELQPKPVSNEFILYIELKLNPEKGAVTFYNSDVLAEDLGTILPLLKVELDDKIKFTGIDLKKITNPKKTGEECCIQNEECCLLKEENTGDVSLYHFFRNVIVKNDDPNNEIITVDVCGMKNFIVQNDESLMDVNNQIYPFGARPKIDSNFYIGPEEIFLKRWSDIFINVNWKDKPVNFKDYYNGYQDFFINAGVEANVVENDNFRMRLSILSDGQWIPWVHVPDCGNPAPAKSLLFQNFVAPAICPGEVFQNQFGINRSNDFGAVLDNPAEKISFTGYKRLDVNTRHSFIKITLKCQDFQHDKYSFVLARQMAAMGKLPQIVDGAVYYGVVLNGPVPQFVVLDIPKLLQELMATYNLSLNPNLISRLRDLIRRINALAGSSPGGQITDNIWNDLFVFNDPISPFPPNNLSDPPYTAPPPVYRHSDFYDNFDKIIDWLKDWNDKISQFKDTGVVIPKEPWTPIISGISLDYSASALLRDIDFIHLYPYAGTNKSEDLNLQPALFPTHCDEGTLFLGLSNLVPGNNLNLLFQMAEATSDSESDKETVFWHYLDSNIWKPLRPGFEVLDDATNNLTGSGIIKLALPANMTNENTVMPKGMHWIKATIPKNCGAVSETTGIHPHAIHVVFTNDESNNKLRLSKPLQAGSISKLEIADASVKSVKQPYESFGGLVPEIEQQFYVRVSETLRHKGRAVQSFDYERLVLQAFPQLFKVKCINHSLALNAHEFKNDFPYAGGYVLMVVIPDLNKLKAGNSFEPKAPVSLLEEVNEFIRQRTSPFVRFRAMNPRYEEVDFCLKIRLQKDKDENYYKEQVREDIRRFLAPWAVGDYYKLTFGQCVYRSDIIQFLETRDYLDFIGDLRMVRKGDVPDSVLPKVCPNTPRSILVAGDIEVCIIPPECEDWGDYSACNETLVRPCDIKPEQISDYCKKRKIIIL